MERLTESEARDVAAALHVTQVDKVGRPYFEYLERVVCILKDRRSIGRGQAYLERPATPGK
jgi:hypothetical protein